MKTNPLKDKRYVSLLRCSTLKQGDTSIADQKTINDAFARDLGMVWVRDAELPGISASKTFNRTDIDVLVAEARQYRNFDVLLVHDLSRLTRGGIRHAAHIRRQFEKVGVRVISASDNIPEGEEAEFFEAFINWKNKIFAKNLAFQGARGLRSSLEAGKRPHCTHTPFGFDRLYLGPDGKPRYLIRQVDGMMRHLIDYETKQVRELPPDPTGHFPPFQKQHDETSKFVIGDPVKIGAVRSMFEMRYKLNCSFTTIQRELTVRGIKPPYTELWSISTIHAIVLNRIYLGHAVAFKITSGVHVMSGKERPLPALVNQSDYEDGSRKCIAPIRRDRSDWWEKDYAELQDIITDPVTRERATAAMDARDEHELNQTHEVYLKNREAYRDRHRFSSYILRDVLRTKDGQFKMSGCTQGGKMKRRRTYIVPDYIKKNPKAAHLGAYIPAVQMETVVVAILRQVFQKAGLIKRMVVQTMDELATKRPNVAANEVILRGEDKMLSKKIRRLINAGDVDGKIDADDEEQINAWKLRRQQIALELKPIQYGCDAIDPIKVVETVSSVLCTPEDNLDGESYFRLRNVVHAWCYDMQIDFDTRELTFGVRVPSVMDLSDLTQGGEMCLQSTFTREAVLEAQIENPTIYARFRCWSPESAKKHKQAWARQWQYLWEQLPSPNHKALPAA